MRLSHYALPSFIVFGFSHSSCKMALSRCLHPFSEFCCRFLRSCSQNCPSPDLIPTIFWEPLHFVMRLSHYALPSFIFFGFSHSSCKMALSRCLHPFSEFCCRFLLSCSQNCPSPDLIPTIFWEPLHFVNETIPLCSSFFHHLSGFSHSSCRMALSRCLHPFFRVLPADFFGPCSQNCPSPDLIPTIFWEPLHFVMRLSHYALPSFHLLSGFSHSSCRMALSRCLHSFLRVLLQISSVVLTKLSQP